MTYNSLLQPASIAAGSLLTLTFGYCPGGGSACTPNNGNVLQQKITADGQSYYQTYDYL
jgi:hypothetical protein